MTTLYDILGVPADASPDEIKRAYHDRAKESHPDVSGAPAEDMQNINKAYAVLKCPDKRSRYDSTGAEDAPDTGAAQLAGIVLQIVQGMLANNPPSVAFYLHALSNDWSRQYASGKQAKTRDVQRLQRFKTRILAGPENDIVGNFVDNSIRALQAEIIKIDVDYNLRLKAIEILKGYTFADVLDTAFVTEA